jgi:dihydroneopterin aldolase
MRATIEVRDLRTTVIIGVLDHERVTPQPIAIDLDLVREVAVERDDVRDTTNYAEVVDLALAVVRDGAFQLLETAAARVAHRILASDDQLQVVTAVVRKLAPPIPHEVHSVGVRATATR